MLTINALITDAFRKCSLVGDNQVPNGNQATMALRDLKSLISELNGQNLILSDVQVADVLISGSKIKIMTLPEGWSVVNELTYGTKRGQIVKFGDKVYCWEPATPGDPSTLQWVERPDIIWPDLVLDPIPDRVVTLSRKIGQRFQELLPAAKQNLDNHTKFGLPSFYTCRTYLETTYAADISYTYEVFEIETDSIQPVTYRITYLKTIPDYELTDKLYFNDKVLSILEDGLCAKLCIRYKLIEAKSLFDDEYANGVMLLKRINNSNRPMVYSEIDGGSYMDNYYNGFSPKTW